MAIDPKCNVEVGTHVAPYWKDENSGLRVCDRHKKQYNTSEFANDFRWIQLKEPTIPYDRQSWIDILVYHYRRADSGCGCGWADLGKSWPEHLVNVYEESIRIRTQEK